MAAANHGHVVGKFITTHDGTAGQEDVGSHAGITGKIEPRSAVYIWNYVERGVAGLRAGFIQSIRAELVEPGRLQGMVKRAHIAAPRNAGQRGYIGVGFPVASIAVAQVKQVAVAELMVPSPGGKILLRVKGKHSTVSFKLVYEESTQRAGGRIDGQNVLQDPRANGSGQCRPTSEAGNWSATFGRQSVYDRHLIILSQHPVIGSKNTRIGQEWNRSLPMIAQAFKRQEHEALVFLEREAQGCAELLPV